MKMRNLVSSLLLGAVISMPVFVYADSNDDAIVKLLATFAGTPEQHQALAKYYKEKAASAKKDLEAHREMKKSYTSNPKSNDLGSMRMMCDRIIGADEAAIQAYEGMAAEHEKGANKHLSDTSH